MPGLFLFGVGMFTVTTLAGERTYDVTTQAEALRLFTAQNPGEPVLGITESALVHTRLTMGE